MKPRSRQCFHDDDDGAIVSITPALPGWGVATLWGPATPHMEFTIHAVAAWAMVRRNAPGCGCRTTVVIPLTGLGDELEFELPTNDPDANTITRILEPGVRAVVASSANGRYYLVTEPGAWTPGYQEIGGDGLSSSNEGEG